MTDKTPLQIHAQGLRARYGTYRAAADAVGVNYSILWKLARGKRCQATDKTLKKLGFQRIERLEKIPGKNGG